MASENIPTKFVHKAIKVWKIPSDVVAKVIEMEDIVDRRNELMLQIAFSTYLTIVDNSFPEAPKDGNYMEISFKYTAQKEVITKYFDSFLHLTNYLG